MQKEESRMRIRHYNHSAWAEVSLPMLDVRNLLSICRQLVRDIQQRDQVIKTLLRQLHSNEDTTHLRIASFPVPQPTSSEVKLWLERQQQSQISNLGNSVESYAMLTQLEDSSEGEWDVDEGSSISIQGSSPTSETALNVLLPPEKRHKASPKLHSLPGTDAPLGLIAAMSLRTAEIAADEDDSSNSNGQSSFDIANKQFFVRSPKCISHACANASCRLQVTGVMCN